MKELFLALVLFVVVESLLITEIMYNPRDYDDFFEYMEIFNEQNSAIDISLWSISPIGFTFPSSTILQPNSHLVITCNKKELVKAYPTLTAVIGDFNHTTNGFSNNGDTITIRDKNSVIQLSFSYTSSAPWPVLANGFGASLELACYDFQKIGLPTSWRASIVPVSTDSHVEYAGSPGAKSGWITVKFMLFLSLGLILC